MSNHQGKQQQFFRKQLVPTNGSQDGKLNSSPLYEIVDFIYGQLKKALYEKKSIEIEGKLGEFRSKSTQQNVMYSDSLRLQTVNTISSSNIVLMRPFAEFFQFDSTVCIKDQTNQIKFYDLLCEQKNNQQNGSSNGQGQSSVFAKQCGVQEILDFDSFECCQNDIVIDFGFEDGTRLKVPLNPNDPVVLDKKNRDVSNNIDFAFNYKYYRISARQEDVINDQNEINKKRAEVREGKYQSVRIKYRKAYRYLFMEYAFTRVFSFSNLSKKKVIEGDNQLIHQTYEEFQQMVGVLILNRGKFSRAASHFFQKSYSTNYYALTKFESEIEIKDLEKYFKKEFDLNDQPTIQSHIRSFIRNLIYLNSISEFFAHMSMAQIEGIKIQKNNNTTPTGYRDGILGQYMESHLFQNN